MKKKYPRQIHFEKVLNFRDLGGYKARGGRTVMWRRLFRSAELANMTRNDFNRLKEEIGPISVIDLRSDTERERRGIGLLSEAGVRYHHISFITDGGDQRGDERRYKDFTNMGDFYVYLVRNGQFGRRIIEALEVIAAPENHPLVFHCAVGKDRTGLLAAILLSVLGVRDEDIIEDYTLSAPSIKEFFARFIRDPKTAEFARNIPGFFWEAVPESMALFLAGLKKEYGSTRDYLTAQGADTSLVSRLENALLA